MSENRQRTNEKSKRKRKAIMTYTEANGPFALTGHMVQNPPYWMATDVVDSNTKEFQPVKLDFPLFSMSQWRMPRFFAIQYGGFLPRVQLLQKAHYIMHY